MNCNNFEKAPEVFCVLSIQKVKKKKKAISFSSSGVFYLPWNKKKSEYKEGLPDSIKYVAYARFQGTCKMLLNFFPFVSLNLAEGD